jgi:hypothetical protein
LQCVLAARILIVDFVVSTLAVKRNQGRFRHVGLDHSLVRAKEEISEMLHLEHSIVWCGNWPLRKLDQKYLESFEMWFWRRMEKISWTGRVNNEAVLHRVKEERNILHTIRRRKAN